MLTITGGHNELQNVNVSLVTLHRYPTCFNTLISSHDVAYYTLHVKAFVLNLPVTKARHITVKYVYVNDKLTQTMANLGTM